MTPQTSIILQSDDGQGKKEKRTKIQKNEYLESENSLLDELKISIFHNYLRTTIW